MPLSNKLERSRRLGYNRSLGEDALLGWLPPCRSIPALPRTLKQRGLQNRAGSAALLEEHPNSTGKAVVLWLRNARAPITPRALGAQPPRSGPALLGSARSPNCSSGNLGMAVGVLPPACLSCPSRRAASQRRAELWSCPGLHKPGHYTRRAAASASLSHQAAGCSALQRCYTCSWDQDCNPCAHSIPCSCSRTQRHERLNRSRAEVC